jgi:hypothetical protein
MTAMWLIGKPATAKDIADFIGEPPSKVNYHVGILHKFGFIDLHHTENIKGIIAKFFCRSTYVFKIKMEGANRKVKEIAAVRDMVASTFDMARDRYIAQVAKCAECEGEEAPPDAVNTKYEESLLYSRKVYMSEEDLEALSKFVDKAAENKKEGRKLYSFFTSYIELEDYK